MFTCVCVCVFLCFFFCFFFFFWGGGGGVGGKGENSFYLTAIIRVLDTNSAHYSRHANTKAQVTKSTQQCSTFDMLQIYQLQI